MKLLILLVALFTVGSATLSDDFADLGAILPSAEMGAVIQKYLDAQDAEVIQIFDYLKSSEFAAVVAEISVNLKWVSLKDFLVAAGVDVDGFLLHLQDLIQNAGPTTPSPKDTRAASLMVDELMALIPTDELIIFLNDKLTNSPDFIAFWEKLTSEETHQLVEEIKAMPEVLRITAVLLEMGIDLNEYLGIIYLFLGWA